MHAIGAPSGVNIKDYFWFREEPLHITTREEAYRALGVAESPGIWFERDWEKVEKNELIFAHDPNGCLLRFARVATLYAKRGVAYRDPEDPTADKRKTVEVLRETIHYPDGTIEERAFNSTVSETMYHREHHPPLRERRGAAAQDDQPAAAEVPQPSSVAER